MKKIMQYKYLLIILLFAIILFLDFTVVKNSTKNNKINLIIESQHKEEQEFITNFKIEQNRINDLLVRHIPLIQIAVTDTRNYPDFYNDELMDLFDQMQNDERVLASNKLNFLRIFPIDKKIVVPDNLDGSITLSEYDLIHGYIATSNKDNMIEFENGLYEIVEGRFYNNQEIKNGERVILVTSEYARLNNLKLGDMIEFYGDVECVGCEVVYDSLCNYYPDNFDGIIEFEIIGIYNNYNVNDYDTFIHEGLTENLFLAPQSAVIDFENMYAKSYRLRAAYVWGDHEKIIYTEQDYYDSIAPSFLLKDKDDLKDFILDYKDKLDPFFYMNYKNSLFNDN